LRRAIIASAIPVLPLVGSSRIRPGARSPAASARAIISRAIRSFTLPVGLAPSSLANSRTRGLGLSRGTSTSGVLPIASTMLENGPAARIAPLGLGSVVALTASPPSGDRRQDRDHVACADRCFELARVPDVLVVDVDVHELAQLPVSLDELPAQSGNPLVQVGDELRDGFARAAHDLLAARDPAQYRWNSNFHCHVVSPDERLGRKKARRLPPPPRGQVHRRTPRSR